MFPAEKAAMGLLPIPHVVQETIVLYLFQIQQQMEISMEPVITMGLMALRKQIPFAMPTQINLIQVKYLSNVRQIFLDH